MTDRIRIGRITDLRDLDRITGWMYEWWGRKEHYSKEAVKCYMAHSFQTDRLPQTYGMYQGDSLIGIYQFVKDDLFVRPDIYPWLANVYIDFSCRGKGYGRLLLSSVKNSAVEAGLSELFLFTEHCGLYEKFGWEYAGTIDTFLEPRLQRLYRLDVQTGHAGSGEPGNKAGTLQE